MRAGLALLVFGLILSTDIFGQIALGEGIMGAESCLTELDLSDNAFGPTGVEPIIPLLTSSSFYTIKVLKFNNNGLGIKGGTVSLMCLETGAGLTYRVCFSS